MDDKKLSKDEWDTMMPAVASAGNSWAPFVALREPKSEDFETMDADGMGFVVLKEFCDWVETTEKLADTDRGHELGTLSMWHSLNLAWCRIPGVGCSSNTGCGAPARCRPW